MNLRTFFKEHKERSKFQKKNPNVILENVQIKGAQYIVCGCKSVIGSGSKLLCWDAYNGMKFDCSPEIRIGKNFHATRDLCIQCARRVIIGDDVLIASGVTIIDYNHGMDPCKVSYLFNPLQISNGIIIGDGVWIGQNAIILPGVSIGDKSIIGAGSVVTHDVPSYCVAVGNPARIIKKYSNTEKKWISIE